MLLDFTEHLSLGRSERYVNVKMVQSGFRLPKAHSIRVCSPDEHCPVGRLWGGAGTPDLIPEIVYWWLTVWWAGLRKSGLGVLSCPLYLPDQNQHSHLTV